MTGHAACTECGELTELLLHSGFPHICALCLFPPTKPGDPRVDAPKDALPPALGLLERLQSAKGNGRWRGMVDSFNVAGMPERYNRGRRE